MKLQTLIVKVGSAVGIFGIVSSMLITTPAHAEYTVKPKIGQCFQLTPAQVSGSYATKNPVNCSSTHNAETFEVIDWPLETNPVDMAGEDAASIANEVCGFWDAFPNAQRSRSSKSQFNYWAWYTPNRAAWAKGERWLRCDAMIGKFKTSTSWPPYAFISWKGSKY